MNESNNEIWECKHNEDTIKTLHKKTQLEEGWIRYECLSCGRVSFTKPLERKKKVNSK